MLIKIFYRKIKSIIFDLIRLTTTFYNNIYYYIFEILYTFAKYILQKLYFTKFLSNNKEDLKNKILYFITQIRFFNFRINFKRL